MLFKLPNSLKLLMLNLKNKASFISLNSALLFALIACVPSAHARFNKVYITKVMVLLKICILHSRLENQVVLKHYKSFDRDSRLQIWNSLGFLKLLRWFIKINRLKPYPYYSYSTRSKNQHIVSV